MAKCRIHFCMTSDFAYDQRMQRIVHALSRDFDCIVIHRSHSQSDNESNANSHNINCLFRKGPLFYIEFNVRLFFLLLVTRGKVIYGVDTDTLAACGLAAMIRQRVLVYDSHEWFTEVPELKGRKVVKTIWSWIETLFIPKARILITVNDGLAAIFSAQWNKEFISIRNMPVKKPYPANTNGEKILLYQGAINEGRGLECLMDTMEYLPDYQCWLVGDGDIKLLLQQKVAGLPWGKQIHLIDRMHPEELSILTTKARFGINLLDVQSKSYHYSLANKFFDYLQAGIPSINMDLPEYRRIVQIEGIGLLLAELHPSNLAKLILEHDESVAYQKLKDNCLRCKDKYTWEEEVPKLLKLFEGLK